MDKERGGKQGKKIKEKERRVRREETKDSHTNWVKSDLTMSYSNFTCDVE